MKKNRYHKRFPRGKTMAELRAQLLLGGGEVRHRRITHADGRTLDAYWIVPALRWRGYERSEHSAIVRWLKQRRQHSLDRADYHFEPALPLNYSPLIPGGYRDPI